MYIWCPCTAHVRRKFVEAEGGDPDLRRRILRRIRHLFMLERVAWSRNAEERLRIRRELEKPILDRITAMVKERLLSGGLLPESNFAKALNYYMGLAPNLTNYINHSDARLDNNVAERGLRPLTIGRKNWLFVGSSEDSGRSAATILSLVQTCRNLGIKPTGVSGGCAAPHNVTSRQADRSNPARQLARRKAKLTSINQDYIQDGLQLSVTLGWTD